MVKSPFQSMPGFTLIELLIVVLIIAILAAIALPNLLEFQVRAKTARARADMRTVATALEAYATDDGDYPPTDRFSTVTHRLTTPIAYISSNLLLDPFMDKDYNPLKQRYTYTKILTEDEYWETVWLGLPFPGAEAVDSTNSSWNFNPGAFSRYGKWRLVSVGPDQEYADNTIPAGPFNVNPGALCGADIPYDPSNGSVSWGNILRFQNHPEGIVPVN